MKVAFLIVCGILNGGGVANHHVRVPTRCLYLAGLICSSWVLAEKVNGCQ